MAQFETFDARVEVNGQTVLAVIDGMSAFEGTARQILDSKGIRDPQGDQWYSQQAWLNAFREIGERIGPATLNAIGKRIPENAKFPPHIDNIVAALSAIDVAYHMNHRIDGQPLFDPETGSMSEGIGHYSFELKREREATMRCLNPYPCDFDRGIVQAMATRFLPEGSKFAQVIHAEGECRKRGSESCTYLVTW